jgi:glutamyl-tRNA synthetase
VRGRFAPSPTGDLHVGNLRTAVFAWRAARDAGSEFLLRVEDLDTARVREEFVERQLADLRAIGVDWDGEPVFQSRRLPLYAAAVERLTERGKTFRCFCSRKDIREAASAPHGPLPPYPGTCRQLSESEAEQRVAAGEQHAVRLRGSGGVDDIVLVRADGVFAYNLAVVVDDADQEIEEVVRGEDLLGSTPAQEMLFDLLGLPRPLFTHVPLVRGPDGEPLSKRHGSITLAELGEIGISPAEVRACLDS